MIWNVLCPGPSILMATEKDLLPRGYTVAVNRAIRAPIGAHAHIWAVWDHPDLIWKDCAIRIRSDLTAWIAPPHNPHLERCLARWEKLLLPSQGYRFMSIGTVAWEDGTRRQPFTLMYVVDKICELGAQKIRILGCDMKGTWRGNKILSRWEPDPTGDMEEEGDWDRWAFERAQVKKMIEVAKTKGVEIELATPSAAT